MPTEKKPQSIGGIAVSGVFTSEKKLEVEMALERLRGTFNGVQNPC